MYGYNYYPQRWRPSGRLMGQLAQPPMRKGARFQFGWNIGYTLDPFEAADIAELTNAAGVTDGAVSYVYAGYLNPFIVEDGKSGRDWASATDLKDAIYNIIVSNGYPIEPASIQFHFEPVQTGATPPVIYTGPPGSPGVPEAPSKSIFDQISAGLKIPKDEAQMLIFGGGLLLLVLVMKR